MRCSILLPLFVPALLAGCINGPRGDADLAQFDFGPPLAAPAVAPPFALRSVEVVTPAWLDSPLLQYRLLHVDAARRESYAGSRWAAPPGELLEIALRRAIVSSEAAGLAPGCKLRVDLDELAHVFEDPATSAGVIEVRAALLAPRNGRLLAQRRFSIAEPAASADAAGGVAAVARGVGRLAEELRAWIAALDRGAQGGLNIREICGGA
jgi:cholesterol transport system auxiliary component